MSEEIENILLSKKISPTPMRVMVLEYFLQQTAAISLNDLENEFSYSDRTTLYRTVKTFEENGLVHDIKDSNEPTKYAMCETDCKNGIHYDRHIHFYCTECKLLVCLPKENLPQINLPEGFELQEVSFVARGICNICKNNAIKLQPHEV